MKLLELYSEILADAGAIVDKEGFVSLARFDEKEPFIVKGKRLVLPTTHQLKNLDPSKSVVFHPLYENALKPEPEVMAEFRRMMAEKLSLNFSALGAALLTLATSPKQHRKLKPQQSKFLSLIPGADERTVEDWGRLIAAMPLGQNQKAFLSIYLRKNGELDGKKHKRLAVVSFPLYTQLVKDGLDRERKMEERAAKKKANPDLKEELPTIPNETYGVSLRKGDREVFLRLIEYLVPGLTEAEAIEGKLDSSMYSRASDALVAPSMHALMSAVEAIADPLNHTIDLFANQLSEGEVTAMKVKGEWVEDFTALASFQNEIRKIPMQAGNDGNPIPVFVPEEEKEAPAAPRPGLHHPAAQEADDPEAEAQAEAADEPVLPSGFKLPPRQPQHHPAPQAQRPPPVQHRPPVAHYPPPPAPQAQHGGYYPPPPSQYDPRYGQPMHPQHQAPVATRTEGGVDFNAALRANPGFGQAVYQAAPRPMQQQAPQGAAGHTPSWAQPQGQQQQYAPPGNMPPFRGGGGRSY